jgi:DNA-directed RNA polymerase specialized sigma subunit
MIDKHITRKPVYPFHTPKNIDFLTKTLKEESVKKLTPREEKEIDNINRDLKRDALKSEIADIIPYDHHNSASYPGDPIQGAKMKNIDALEKSLEDDHPYMQHKMEQPFATVEKPSVLTLQIGKIGLEIGLEISDQIPGYTGFLKCFCIH